MDDLISRSALLERMNALYHHHIEEMDFCEEGAVGDCIVMVENAPAAADAAPVVHGRWLDIHGNPVALEDGATTKSSFCSVCRDWLTGSDEYRAKGRLCPNCGAKMDGGDE